MEISIRDRIQYPECQECGATMLLRNGKFGEFFYCGRGSHGTISAAKHVVSLMRAAAQRLQVRAVDVQSAHDLGGTADPLLARMDAFDAGMGLRFSETEKFCVDYDGEHIADNWDDQDAWYNIRPY